MKSPYKSVEDILGLYLTSYSEAKARLEQGKYDDDEYEEVCQKYDAEAKASFYALLASKAEPAHLTHFKIADVQDKKVIKAVPLSVIKKLFEETQDE